MTLQPESGTSITTLSREKRGLYSVHTQPTKPSRGNLRLFYGVQWKGQPGEGSYNPHFYFFELGSHFFVCYCWGLSLCSSSCGKFKLIFRVKVFLFFLEKSIFLRPTWILVDLYHINVLNSISFLFWVLFAHKDDELELLSSTLSTRHQDVQLESLHSIIHSALFYT